MLSVGFIGTVTNQFLKLIFRVPRPWVLDSNFTILEQAREAATGYSFPSGHTQSAVGTFGAVAYITKNRWIRIGAILVAVLVPFSRMYIGVHTPADVLTSVVIAVLLVVFLRPVVLGDNKRGVAILLSVMTAMAAGLLCFVSLYQFPENIDVHNLASGVKNAYTLLGSLLGLIVVYIIDEKWLKFTVDAAWWGQILKVVFGLILVLAVKSGLKAPFNALLGESVGRAVRYFLIVLTAGCGWPLSFRWFAKFKIK